MFNAINPPPNAANPAPSFIKVRAAIVIEPDKPAIISSTPTKATNNDIRTATGENILKNAS